MNPKIKSFLSGLMIAVFVFSFAYSFYILIYGETPKSVQVVKEMKLGREEYEDIGSFDSLAQDDFLNITDILNKTLTGGTIDLGDTSSEEGDLSQTPLEQNGGEQDNTPFVSEILFVTKLINQKYDSIKDETNALRDKNMFAKINALPGIKENLSSQLSDELLLKTEISEFKIRHSLAENQLELLNLLSQVNELHIKVLETSIQRIDSMDTRFDDIEKWDMEASDLYNKSILLSDSL